MVGECPEVGVWSLAKDDGLFVVQEMMLMTGQRSRDDDGPTDVVEALTVYLTGLHRFNVDYALTLELWQTELN